MKTEIDVMAAWLRERFGIPDEWDSRLAALDLLNDMRRHEFSVISAIEPMTVSNRLPGSYEEVVGRMKQQHPARVER